MVQDVYTAAAANRDMAVIFPAGIALSRASDRLAWEPGQARQCHHGALAPHSWREGDDSRTTHYAVPMPCAGGAATRRHVGSAPRGLEGGLFGLGFLRDCQPKPHH